MRLQLSVPVKGSSIWWICSAGYPGDVQTEASLVANASTS